MKTHTPIVDWLQPYRCFKWIRKGGDLFPSTCKLTWQWKKKKKGEGFVVCKCVCAPPGCTFIRKKGREKKLYCSFVCNDHFWIFLPEVWATANAALCDVQNHLTVWKSEEISAVTPVWTTFYSHMLRGWISRTWCRLTQRKLLYGA